MDKNANGRGSVSYEASRKRWRGAITSPQGSRVVKRFLTKEEAERWVIETRAEVYGSTFIEPSEETLGEWVIMYISTFKSKKIRHSTLVRYFQTAKQLDELNKIKLQSLTAERVQRFLNNTPISGSCKRKAYSLLNMAMKKAYALDKVKKNIMLNVEPPRYVQEEVSIFTQEEITRLLDYLRSDQVYSRYYPLVSLAVATGARLGELLGLKLSCVHEASISIKNSLQQIGGKFYDSEVKTKAGYREVTITPSMASTLRKLAMTGNVLGMDFYVFHTKSGKVLTPNNFEKAWVKILANAGIPRKHFHALRHTHATQLLAHNVPLLEVAKRLGHSDPSHTLVLYGHAVKDYDLQLPEKVESIFFKNSQGF